MNEVNNNRPRVVWKDGKCISYTNTSSTNKPVERNTQRTDSRRNPLPGSSTYNYEKERATKKSSSALRKSDTYIGKLSDNKKSDSKTSDSFSSFISGLLHKPNLVAAFLIILTFSIVITMIVTTVSNEKEESEKIVNTNDNLVVDDSISDKEPVKSLHGRGHAVCIDPGHGFDDEGTSNPEIGVYEKNVVLNVGLALKEKLETSGIKVYMTHDTNEPPIGSSEPYLFGMKKRNGLANSLSDVALFISIHCDAYYEDTSVAGVRIYHMDGESESESVAQSIYDAVVKLGSEKTPIINAMSGMNSYQVIRESQMPSVLVETGFVSNTDEGKAMLTDEWVDNMAQALADAIIVSFENGIIGEQ